MFISENKTIGTCKNEAGFFSGKAVGGRKAKENRLMIKHLTAEDSSSSFHDDLNTAASKILNEHERFVEKNKEKRKVIKEQTKETRTSMADSILLGKVNFALRECLM